MRRLFAVSLLMLFLIGSAYAADSEITFQNIPWLSDEETVVNALMGKGFIGLDAQLKLKSERSYYLIVDDSDFVSPDYSTGVENVSILADVSGFVRGRIAGCAVKNLRMTFAYDGVYHLIAVEVELITGAYNIIEEKLAKVYGEGEEMRTDEGIESIVWKGENNSAVVLYTQNEGRDYTLMYGRLDAEDILSNCLMMDYADLSGL